MIDWSKQGFVLIVAGLLSLYWTSKHGLLDVLTGALDKEWKDAHQLLAKKVAAKGYVVIDGTNSIGVRRMLVLTERRGETAGQAPKVAAEVYPVVQHRGRRDNHRSRGRHNTRRGRHNAKDIPKDPVARIHIHDPKLDFLREIFNKDKIGHSQSGYHLFEVNDPPRQDSTPRPPSPQTSSYAHNTKRTPPHPAHRPSSNANLENLANREVDDAITPLNNIEEVEERMIETQSPHAVRGEQFDEKSKDPPPVEHEPNHHSTTQNTPLQDDERPHTLHGEDVSSNIYSQHEEL